MAMTGIGSSTTRKRVDPTRFERVRPVCRHRNDMSNSISGDFNPYDNIDVSRTGIALFDVQQTHLREFGGGRQ